MVTSTLIALMVAQGGAHSVDSVSVRFASGSSELSNEALEKLETLLPALAERSSRARVFVEGHTDATEARAVGRARAATLERWLLAHGIDSSVLTVADYGATQPTDENGSASGRAANRRVEVRLERRKPPKPVVVEPVPEPTRERVHSVKILEVTPAGKTAPPPVEPLTVEPVAPRAASEAPLSVVLHFASGSAVISPDARVLLDSVIENLKKRKTYRVFVEGHTDAREAKPVGRSRAEAVRLELLKAGMFDSMVQVDEYGSSQPTDDNRSESGREANRRVEVRVERAK